MICGLSFILLFFFERLVIHHLLHRHHQHGTNGIPLSENKASPLLHDHHAIEVQEVAEQPEEAEKLHIQRRASVADHFEDLPSMLNQKQYFSSVVLLLGLGTHSILEGLALGSSATDSEIVSVGIAILSHKYLASFAVGVPLKKAMIPLKVAALIAFGFAILTPTGILIGYALRQSFASEPWVSDIFVSIAAGTFLYVAICEIMIPEFSEGHSTDSSEKENDHHELVKMACVLLGFALMSILAIYA